MKKAMQPINQKKGNKQVRTVAGGVFPGALCGAVGVVVGVGALAGRPPLATRAGRHREICLWAGVAMWGAAGRGHVFLVGASRGPRHESECSLSSRNAWLHKIQIKYTLGAGPFNDEGHAANKSKEGQQASENGSRRRFPRSPVRGCGGSGWGGCLGWAPPPGH